MSHLYCVINFCDACVRAVVHLCLAIVILLERTNMERLVRAQLISRTPSPEKTADQHSVNFLVN
jgi:hypothetical protein